MISQYSARSQNHQNVKPSLTSKEYKDLFNPDFFPMALWQLVFEKKTVPLRKSELNML